MKKAQDVESDAEFLRKILLPGDYEAAKRLHEIASRLDNPVADAALRLATCASAWQKQHDLTLPETIEKAIEEADEFRVAAAMSSETGMLDEAGDVIVSTLRALVALSPAQREFVCRVAEMKATRRLRPGGIKDKSAESKIQDALARELLG